MKISEEKCRECGVILISDINWFPSFAKKLCRLCKECARSYHRKFVDDNREDINSYRRNWWENNKDRVNSDIRQDRKNNPEKFKEIDKRGYLVKMTKMSQRIRRTISSKIHKMLFNKSDKSITISKYLEYSIDDLIKHLENLFESWMTWKNYGIYNPKTWNDNDPLTWTWQIDHIKPVSEFNFSTIKDEEFKMCWALNNLRPYSAKQNIIDGASKVRHSKTSKRNKNK